MPAKDTKNSPVNRVDQPPASLTDQKNDIRRIKPKDQGIVEADDQKEDREIYDGSLELKIEEGSEEHNGHVVEEVGHEPWGKEPEYGYQYDEEIISNEIAAGEGVYTPEGREELVEDDEITTEEAFYMEGRDKVLKRKTKGYTNNPEIQAQWKDD
jgi:hypothetical protein